jgi:hypothetical protein
MLVMRLRTIHFGPLTANRDANGTWTISETNGLISTIITEVRPKERVMTNLLFEHIEYARQAGTKLHHAVLTLTPLEALRLHLEGTLRAFGVRVQTRENDWEMRGTLILLQPSCVLDVQIPLLASAGSLAPSERPRRH